MQHNMNELPTQNNLTFEQKKIIYTRATYLACNYIYEELNDQLVKDHYYDKFVSVAAKENKNVPVDFYDDIFHREELFKSGMWVPRNDQKLIDFSKKLIEAKYKNKDEIVHGPEFCKIFEEVYGYNIFF